MLGKPKKDNSEIERFKERLKYLLSVMVSAYYSPLLRWWETVAIIICGALLGVGIGVALYAIYIRPMIPREIIVVLNETHIMRVRP
jgi:hypothetical protein